jgi:gluconolactonase
MPTQCRERKIANLCFGGTFRNRLYICGSTSLYAVYTSATGAMKP